MLYLEKKYFSLNCIGPQPIMRQIILKRDFVFTSALFKSSPFAFSVLVIPQNIFVFFSFLYNLSLPYETKLFTT